MNNALLVKNVKKITTEKTTDVDRAKFTFNRLRHKIEVLQNCIKAAQINYEKALSAYHTDLEPQEKKLSYLITQFIVKTRELTRDKKKLTKNEKAALQELHKNDINLLFECTEPSDLHGEIHVLHEEIYGHSIDDAFKEGLEEAFAQMKEEFGSEGFDKYNDMDWGDFNATSDNFEEIIKKFAKAAEENESQRSREAELNPKPKSKKELLKEEKARQLEEWKNKGIGSLYKRLAKELHPDLEQNPERRIEKSHLMKQLTAAYEKRDLITLLELESECLNQMDQDTATSSEDRLKVYNTLLKDQIQDLETQLRMIRLNPRYYDLQRCLQGQDEDVDPLECIQQARLEVIDMIKEYEKRIASISGEGAVKILKKRLQEYHSANTPGNIPIALLELVKTFQDLGMNIAPEGDFFDSLFAEDEVNFKPKKKKR